MDEEKSGGLSPLVMVVVVVVLLLVGAFMVLTPRHGHSRIWSHEAAASAMLKAYLTAQNMFHRTDFYGKKELVYANPDDGVGFPDLYAVGGPDPGATGSGGDDLRLIDLMMAKAWPGGTSKAGYFLDDIVADAEGPYDFSVECGLCAVPESYNVTGRHVFIIDIAGTVYQKDAAAVYPGLRAGDPVRPVTVWPDVKKDGWEVPY